MFPAPMIKALKSLIFRGPIADGDLALLALMVINRLPFTDMLVDMYGLSGHFL